MAAVSCDSATEICVIGLKPSPTDCAIAACVTASIEDWNFFSGVDAADSADPTAVEAPLRAELLVFLVILRAIGFMLRAALFEEGPSPRVLIIIGRKELPCRDEASEGTGGVSGGKAGDDVWLSPDLTLTTVGLPLMIVVAGIGLMTALSRYTVVATLLRAKLDAIEPGLRPWMSDMSEYVESRKSPGTKKCWSSKLLFVMEEGVVGIGIGGTGGTSKPGEDELVRFVTPGMYAI